METFHVVFYDDYALLYSKRDREISYHWKGEAFDQLVNHAKRLSEDRVFRAERALERLKNEKEALFTLFKDRP